MRVTKSQLKEALDSIFVTVLSSSTLRLTKTMIVRMGTGEFQVRYNGELLFSGTDESKALEAYNGVGY